MTASIAVEVLAPIPSALSSRDPIPDTPAVAAATGAAVLSPDNNDLTKSAIALNGDFASADKDLITFPVIPPIPDNIEVKPLLNVPIVEVINPKEPLRRSPIPLSAPSPSLALD